MMFQNNVVPIKNFGLVIFFASKQFFEKRFKQDLTTPYYFLQFESSLHPTGYLDLKGNSITIFHKIVCFNLFSNDFVGIHIDSAYINLILGGN